MGGAVLIETVFNLNGLGKLMLESVTSRDYPIVQAMALYTAVIVVVVFLSSTWRTPVPDPRCG
jgi:peptide/nickel transport system permease protein